MRISRCSNCEVRAEHSSPLQIAVQFGTQDDSVCSATCVAEGKCGAITAGAFMCNLGRGKHMRIKTKTQPVVLYNKE